MPIKTEDRHFAEGVSTHGEKDPRTAIRHHRDHVRTGRVAEVIGENGGPDILPSHTHSQYVPIPYFIVKNIDAIIAAIKGADEQVKFENSEFLREHKIKSVKEI